MLHEALTSASAGPPPNRGPPAPILTISTNALSIASSAHSVGIQLGMTDLGGARHKGKELEAFAFCKAAALTTDRAAAASEKSGDMKPLPETSKISQIHVIVQSRAGPACLCAVLR